MMTDQQANDEGADPSDDVKAQNPEGVTTADMVDEDDDSKAEKVTKAGRDIDPDQGSD